MHLSEVSLGMKDGNGSDANVISVILSGNKNLTGNDYYVDEICRKGYGRTP
jgi:hypothetical protein